MARHEYDEIALMIEHIDGDHESGMNEIGAKRCAGALAEKPPAFRDRDRDL